MEAHPAPEADREGSGAPPRSLAYIPGLDGLRALAVLAVLLYHADLPVYGGFLGVESFFVISGFLITALLLADWGAHGRVGLRSFWWRRARRLLPALFVLLAGVAALTAVLLPEELGSLGVDTLAALAYVTNWQLIAGGNPYFDPIARPPLLQHLWSLAVEEQFYILWPLLFAAGMRLLGARPLLALTLAGAAVSAGLVAARFIPGADPSRLYYGTDTRAAGLLAGAALAFVWAPGRAPALARPWAGRALDAGGMLALAALLGAYALMGEGHPLLYRGGLALVALITAALVAAATHPAARLLPRLLELAPLRWVGVRSYSLYLWHWPVFMLTRPGIDLPLEGPPAQALRFALAFGLAALSYSLVELPVRRGALERAWAAWAPARHEWSARAWAPLGAVLALSLALSYLGASIAQAAVRQGYAGAAPRSAFAAPPAHAPIGGLAVAAGHAGAEARPTVAAAPLAAPTPTAAPPEGQALPRFDPALAERLQALLGDAVADGSIPGAVLSVRLPDGATWTGTAGLADRDSGEPMTAATRVRIGSLSKMFTAVAVLQLAEEGAIGLDDPVADYLPGLIPGGEAIAVRQLLQHTSGLYDYLEDRLFVAEAYADPEGDWAPKDLVDYAVSRPPTFAPGEGWDYSNTNYVVLGMLVEAVTGNTLADELDARIFTPLGLAATASVPPDEVDGPQARGYSRGDGQEVVSLSFAFGTANIVTTADDLRRFGEALFGGELLAPDSLAQMRRFVGGNGQYDMPALEYGLGLMSNRLPAGPAEEGEPVVGHIGGINGFRAALWYAPGPDLLVALGVNQGATDPNDLAAAVLDALLADLEG